MPAEDRFYELMRRYRKLDLDTRQLEDTSISPAQMALLDWIAAAPGCGVQDIADGLVLAPPTVSVGVRRLEESSLVERKPDPHDGRSVELFLTQRGQALQRRVRDSHRRKSRRLLAGFSPQESEMLLKLLERVLDTAEIADS
ncbi:MAG: hypothetical protein A2Z14_02010 [Chloroflexi bacterium RBG_16_48_8]|nr:MAG: hypothetical protein A2Z14_02010 [Chloroflexi bacterium RBG_16_48_8]